MSSNRERAEPCPRCPAKAGEPCVYMPGDPFLGLTGAPMAGVHGARRLVCGRLPSRRSGDREKRVCQ